ncbi:glycerophosphodiester phosphodiesterase [Macrococcus armenti]|uniref:glycerophosphodiester phosphodiesterase n=1 Tax=Macrococcus armenti TaxID=2875764 RepID=UPI001CCBC3E5|nr:glycerophosphodiester phosphodiesterase [Macrococcus armenti]UBH13941.1 glycerophosphodiester phosphodiesterase [Macrococcus armenti]
MNKYIKSVIAVSAAYAITTTLAKRKSMPEAKSVKPFFNGRAPYIFAHRGGLYLRPEHTMAAFNNAHALGVDGFEIDIRLTKDHQVVVLHDETVDRVSNGSGLVFDHTLNELKQLDFGFQFKDLNGAFPYRHHADCKVVTLHELINAFPEMRINIDIKDAPDTHAGRYVIEALYNVIKYCDAFDRVVITSFYDAQIKRFRNRCDAKVAYGAGQGEVAKTFLMFQSGYGNFTRIDADTFQIPVQFNGIALDTQKFIHWLQKQNVAPGYWVINSIDQMKQLLNNGAHTIVTDRPDIAVRLKQQ